MISRFVDDLVPDHFQQGIIGGRILILYIPLEEGIHIFSLSYTVDNASRSVACTQYVISLVKRATKLCNVSPGYYLISWSHWMGAFPSFLTAYRFKNVLLNYNQILMLPEGNIMYQIFRLHLKSIGRPC